MKLAQLFFNDWVVPVFMLFSQDVRLVHSAIMLKSIFDLFLYRLEVHVSEVGLRDVQSPVIDDQ